MIQRIQNLYLFIAFICSTLLMFFPIYFLKISQGGEILTAEFGAHGLQIEDTSTSNMPLYILFIIMAMLSILGFFLFKNRKKQLLVTRFNLMIQLMVAIAFLVFSLFGKTMLFKILEEKNYPINDITFEYGIGYFLLFIGIPFLFLAIRGIRSDEELLKSIDRIR